MMKIILYHLSLTVEAKQEDDNFDSFSATPTMIAYSFKSIAS